jgi:hypothetical protein
MDARIRVIKSRALASLLLICAPVVSGAAELANETLQAWRDYIRSANLRMEERINGRSPFLWVDESTDRSRRVRAGEIVVSAVDDHNPVKAPEGLIHVDWSGPDSER